MARQIRRPFTREQKSTIVSDFTAFKAGTVTLTELQATYGPRTELQLYSAAHYRGFSAMPPESVRRQNNKRFLEDFVKYRKGSLPFDIIKIKYNLSKKQLNAKARTLGFKAKHNYIKKAKEYLHAWAFLFSP